MNRENLSDRSVPRIIRTDVPNPTEYLDPNLPKPRGRRHRKIFDLAAGESPFGLIPIYDRVVRSLAAKGELTRTAEHYGGGVTDRIALLSLRRLYGLGNEPYVAFVPGGSDSALETIILKLLDPYKRPAEIFTIGPTYPHIQNFSGLYGGEEGNPALPVRLFTTPLEEKRPAAESFRLLTDAYRRETSKRAEELRISLEEAESLDLTGVQRKLLEEQVAVIREQSIKEQEELPSRLVYIATPNNPTGEEIPSHLIEDFVDRGAENPNDLFVIDEAFLSNPKNSAAPLTRNHNNLIVLQSLSKMAGMAGHRVGILIASEGIGEYYEKMRRIYDLDGYTKLVLNHIIPSMGKYMRDRRNQTTYIKRAFMGALSERGISIFGTSDSVPVFFCDGKRSDFHQRLFNQGVITAPGDGFAETHPDLKALKEKGEAGRYVRSRIPSSIDDVEELADRFAYAAYGDDEKKIIIP